MERDCRLSAIAVVEGSTDDGVVLLRPQSACAACAGSCLWKRIGTVRLPGAGAAGLQRGDRVEVTLPAGSALLGASVAYGLPLAGLLAGAAMAAQIDVGDTVVLAGALAGLAVAYAATLGFRGRIERAVLARCTIAKSADTEC